MTILLWTVGVGVWTMFGAVVMTCLIRIRNHYGDALIDPTVIAMTGLIWPLFAGIALLMGAFWLIGRGVIRLLPHQEP